MISCLKDFPKFLRLMNGFKVPKETGFDHYFLFSFFFRIPILIIYRIEIRGRIVISKTRWCSEWNYEILCYSGLSVTHPPIILPSRKFFLIIPSLSVPPPFDSNPPDHLWCHTTSTHHYSRAKSLLRLCVFTTSNHDLL